MSVHYKFKSAVEYDTLPVDGLNISLGDLKESIIQQKRLGKGQPFDLQITNAETKEIYTDEKILIPKNSSLIVARVPIDPSQMKRPWENLKDATAVILANPANIMNTEDAAEAAEIDRKIKEVTDLTLMDGSEQDKINAMVAQSTIEYHPSKYVKLRASKMTGVVPIGYKCYKCNQSGHWVTMCPLNNQDLRKSTGIPSMFLEEVEDPNTPGVMISATGKLVRLRDMVTNEKAANFGAPSDIAQPPEELQCRLCNDLMKDAVLIPCCAAAFCDDCIRNHLLDSEEHVCPACQKEGIGPDTLIPNRYLRIKVQQFECGCFYGDKKADAASDSGEPLSSVPLHVLKSRNTPTPPMSPSTTKSPTHSASPSKIRINDKLVGSPASLASLSPVHGSSPSRMLTVEPIGNGEIGSDKESIIGRDGCENKDATHEPDSSGILAENETQSALEEKENIEVNEGDSDIDGKHKKIKKKKAKRKNSRHEEEGESDDRERKRRERKSSHRSQERSERKSKRRDMELLKDVDDLPQDKADLWDDDRGMDSILQKHDDLTPKKKKRHRNKDLLQDALDSEEEHEKGWNDDRPLVEGRGSRDSRNRSRSNSGDKDRETPAVYVPFNPLVPPPNFVKSPPQDYTYPITSTYAPQVAPPIPVTNVTTYPHYQPGLIADPLAEFEKHLREKDERAARRQRYSRSRSPSRSPRYRRGRSRSRQRTWSRSRSRSRSRSISRARGVVSTLSPRSPSRRRWSRSPPPRGHASYRSRSPSFARDHSVSNRSLSLSRTPSPNRRIMSPSVPIHPVHQPVHPEALLPRPPPQMDYGVPRDYNRYPMGSLPQDQYPPQPGYQPPNPHWDARYNQGMPETYKPNFPDHRGRGGRGRRGRGVGFRQGNNFGFEQRGQEFRHQYDRSQHMQGDRHGMPNAGWDREGRKSYTVELPRSDRGNRYPDGERKRYPEEYEDVRTRRDPADNVRRHDEGHSHVYSSDDEWRRFSDDGKKRDEDSDRRKYENRRGLEDRKDDSDSRRVSDGDEFDDYKRSRKDGEGRRSFEKRYKDTDDVRSNRPEREGKHRSATHRDSPRDEDSLYRSKPYDSPAKSHKKSSPKERRDRDLDRKERDVEKRIKESDRRDKDADKKDRDSDRRERENDKRERDIDKREREGDRRVKDGERRDRDTDRRERDDRRDRDYDKQERDTDRRDKEYERKDSFRRDREQDRKSRDADKKDKDFDRRDRDSSRREKEPVNKDKNERNDDDHRRDRDGERPFSSRWDHGDTKVRSENEVDSKSRSQEREGSLTAEEKDHKRKSKRKEEKEDGHHKEKGDDPDTEKVEKKKHEKKKKKKEKRRASQASTEVSQGELSGDEGEDKKKKKKRDKKKKAKGASSGNLVETTDSSKPSANDDPSVENVVGSEPPKEIVERADDENTSEMAPRELTPNPEPKEASPSSLLGLPPLSKWERDEELLLTPKGLVENKAPEEEKKVTDDILKRAENTIFSGRGLANRKVFLEHQKQKEIEEREKSPTPEWERLETREAKRRGPSIQITISSKTESQIGRPRGGRHQPTSPEHVEEKKYPTRTRRSTDTDNKTEKNSKTQKRSQSPSEVDSVIKTRRRSEKEEHSKEEKDVSSETLTEATDFKKVKSLDGDQDPKSSKSDLDTDVGMPAKSLFKEDVGHTDLQDTKLKSEIEGVSDSTFSYATLQEDSKLLDLSDKLMEENINVMKGVKRSSPSSNESEVKKLKLNDELPSCKTNENVERLETSVDFEERKDLHSEGEAEFAVGELGGTIGEVKTQMPTAHAKSNFGTFVKAEELEEGEITTDSSGDDETACKPPPEPAVESTFVIQGNISSSITEEPLKSPPKIRHSPIRVPSPVEPSKSKEMIKIKEKKKRKKRKRSSSSSSSNSSSSSSSSSSSEDEEIVKKKKKKKKKKKAVDSDSSDGETQKKHKKKKKEKKKKKKKEKKKKSDK